MAVKHTIRTSEDGRIKLEMSQSLAIKLKCMDCLGYEGNPKDCTSVLCPLYPFRGKTLRSMHGYKPRELSDEQKANLAAGLKRARESKTEEDNLHVDEE